jgi:uncharacterized membrane protein
MTRFLSRQPAGLLAALLLVGIASALHAQTVTTFDAPYSTNTIPQANNRFGQITGYYEDANFVAHGFLRQLNGTFVTFDPTGSIRTQATSINDVGQITGYYFDAEQAPHGFVRQADGTFTTFDAPPNSPDPVDPDVCEWRTTGTQPQAINLKGQITGEQIQRLVGLTPGVACGGLRYQGFLRDRDGSMTTFGISYYEFVGPVAINFLGQITGYYQVADDGPQGGLLRQPDGTITIFGADDAKNGACGSRVCFMRATAMNLFGQIVGYYNDESQNPTTAHSFLRQPNGTFVTFDPTGSIFAQATSINNVGKITGYYFDVDNISHGFVRQWNGAITTFDVPGAATAIQGQGGTFPQDINVEGQITGYFLDANLVLHGFLRDHRKGSEKESDHGDDESSERQE